MAKLAEIADIIRSKNAGPFELTLDVMFTQRAEYKRVVDAAVLTAERIGRLYRVDPSCVSVYHVEAALAIKATLPRSISCGTVGDRDVFGAQQHIPLLEIEVP